MRVLVTGATGKVGNAVARRLAERRDDVVALVRDERRGREALPDPITLVRGDVTDPASLRGAAEGAEAVFNCMGLFEQWLPDPGVFERVNAHGARNVVQAAREAGARRVVHTSTFDVFEAPQGGTVSEARVASAPKPTPYERSKQLAERLVLEEAGVGAGIEVVICNPSAVFGPGPWAASGVDGMLSDAIRRRLPALPPGGMTLVYVDDVAAGHLAALDKGRPGERYILAEGFADAREIAAEGVAAAGRGWVPPRMPLALARVLARAGEAVAKRVGKPPLLGSGQLQFLQWRARADNSKAREELGIEFTPWREGIAHTVAWMRESGRI